MYPTISARGVADQACVLLGTGAPSSTGMAVTGAELVLPLAVATTILLVGTALIIASRRRSSDGSVSAESGRPVRSAVALGMLAGLAVSLAGITGPAGAEAPADGCSLIEFTSRSAPGDILIDGVPTEIQRVELGNPTSFDIDVSFSATVLRDDDGLAPFVQVTGDCSCSSRPILDATLAAASSSGIDGSGGAAIRLRAGQSVVVTLSAATTPGIQNPLQDASATYSLVAHARQAAA